MTRGELAKRAEVNRETIRYYERRGLIPKAARNPSSGYRDFDDEMLQRLRFIKSAQNLGFTLEEIDDLLTLRADPRTDCDQVKTRALDKLDEIEGKIRELRKMKRALAKVVDQCTGTGPAGACPILEALDS